jgi:hypothetical protein
MAGKTDALAFDDPVPDVIGKRGARLADTPWERLMSRGWTRQLGVGGVTVEVRVSPRRRF